MIMRRKTKDIIFTIISILVIIGLIGGLVGLFKNNSQEEGYKEIKLQYEIGGLTSYGKYYETESSLYTKESFDCFGLKTELNFDSTISYKIFYYDENDNFVTFTGPYTSNEEIYVPAGAEKARIEITPVWDDDVDEEDRVVKWNTKTKYTKQLTVKTSTKFNDLEVAKDVFAINVTLHNPESISYNEVFITDSLQDSLTTDFYRIYLTGTTDMTLVAYSKYGQENKIVDCDYVLALYNKCLDEQALAVVKLISSSSDFTDYKAKYVENTDGTYTLYLSKNNAALTNYVDSIK